MSSTNIYYIYAYLRSKNSKTAKAGTPYYIGKGKNGRAFDKVHHCPVPKDKSFIVFLETGLSEIGALALERRLIEWWGRKDNKSGILLNRTSGGDGASGSIKSAEHRRKISEAAKNMSIETRRKMSSAQIERFRKVTKKAGHEDTPINIDMTTRKTCPACHVAPVAINCYKNGKVYYRDRCDKCIRAGKKAKPPVPTWIKSGYKKKSRCEKCGFVFKFPEQSTVVYLDGNDENTNWSNLRTICSNCEIEVSHSNLPWKSSTIRADF